MSLAKMSFFRFFWSKWKITWLFFELLILKRLIRMATQFSLIVSFQTHSYKALPKNSKSILNCPELMLSVVLRMFLKREETS